MILFYARRCINALFNPLEKLAEATRRFATLNNELSEILSTSEDRRGNRKTHYRNKILHKKPVSARKLQELKLAFSEFYLFLILLQNYQTLNFTGFRKILKKHDKVRRRKSIRASVRALFDGESYCSSFWI